MGAKIKTAIFPVAGLGTRLLPATKSVPKELLPIIDTPVIQFAVDEALEAGIERLIFVSHPSKSAIENYLRQDADLRASLLAAGKTDHADLLEWLSPVRKAEIIFTMQHERRGLGHAVLCAKKFCLPEPVAVLLPDDLIAGERGCLAQMIAAYDPAIAGHLVATMPVAPEDVSSYGVLSIQHEKGRIHQADGIVEKPSQDKAPSNSAVVGRYILHPLIFDSLAKTPPGKGGEIQLTDAIAASLPQVGLAGYQFIGDRYDCGGTQGLLAATLARAHSDPAHFENLQALGLSNQSVAAE